MNIADIITSTEDGKWNVNKKVITFLCAALISLSGWNAKMQMQLNEVQELRVQDQKEHEKFIREILGRQAEFSEKVQQKMLDMQNKIPGA